MVPAIQIIPVPGSQPAGFATTVIQPAPGEDSIIKQDSLPPDFVPPAEISAGGDDAPLQAFIKITPGDDAGGPGGNDFDEVRIQARAAVAPPQDTYLHSATSNLFTMFKVSDGERVNLHVDGALVAKRFGQSLFAYVSLSKDLDGEPGGKGQGLVRYEGFNGNAFDPFPLGEGLYGLSVHMQSRLFRIQNDQGPPQAALVDILLTANDFELDSSKVVRWKDASGGQFADESRWLPDHVPDATEIAVLDEPGVYQISLAQEDFVDVQPSPSSQDWTVGGLVVGGTDTHVFFEHDDFTLNGGELRVTNEPDEKASLTVTGSGGVDFELVRVGVDENSDGSLFVTGSDAKLTVGEELAIGLGGKGELTVSDGAEVDVEGAGLSIGADRLGTTIIGGAVGFGTVTVGGTGSKIKAPLLSIADQFGGSVGRLIVTSGATAEFRQGRVGTSSGPVSNSGAGSILVKGGTLNFTDTGEGDPIENLVFETFLAIGGDGYLEVNGLANPSKLESKTAVIGIGEGPQGAAKVRGSNAAWTADTIYVSPYPDSPGRLDVQIGGSVVSNLLHLSGQSQMAVHTGGKLTTNHRATVGVPIQGLGGSGLSPSLLEGDVVASVAVNGTQSVWNVKELIVGGGEEFPDAQGFLQISNGGKVIADKVVAQTGGAIFGNGGTLDGTVEIEDGGTIAPGLSPGTLEINGDLIVKTGGIVEIEIAGPNPGTDYDQLIVNGNVQLGGQLNLVFLEGFVPSAGQTLDFFVADTIAGQFDNVIVDGLPGDVTTDLGFGGRGLSVVVPVAPPTSTGGPFATAALVGMQAAPASGFSFGSATDAFLTRHYLQDQRSHSEAAPSGIDQIDHSQVQQEDSSAPALSVASRSENVQIGSSTVVEEAQDQNWIEQLLEWLKELPSEEMQEQLSTLDSSKEGKEHVQPEKRSDAQSDGNASESKNKAEEQSESPSPSVDLENEPNYFGSHAREVARER